ncbi:hypothetical protein QYE76_061036 [Lolium multiflorum]|uniref:F-box domain-containing protein n=1 Tax=Lolium multiflorum TaxID=4521 RepID=A0AAD8W4B8_LOLMU|nr:hypothetical protein QYE76_061036 [Lolium multiflorum]
MVQTRNCRRRRASWGDLPEDMLGDVLGRLPSFADRARLRAVCRAWRAAWRRQPHPPLPWLVVPGHCVSLPDGAIHHVALLPDDARAAPCRGSLGNWLALVPLGAAAPFLLNPFSVERVPLPPWPDQHEPIRKIVMSSAASDSCVVAAMVDCGENRRRIAVCRPGDGHDQGAWWPVSLPFDLQDIAFYKGRLHALPSCHGLVVFDDGELDLLRREPWRLHEKQLPPPPAANIDYDDDEDITSRQYLLECNGRLHTVTRSVRREIHRTVRIKVHALEPDGSWVRVEFIGGHALFVGDACSGAYPAAAGAAVSTSDDLIRENQVCYVDDEMAISAELDKRSRSALTRTTVEVSSRRCDLYGSVLRRLRTVEAYITSGKQCRNDYRAGHLSARTGRWHPTRLRSFW